MSAPAPAAPAPAYLAESMATLEKKSEADGLDNVSVGGESVVDAEAYLPGDSHIRGSGMLGTFSNLVVCMRAQGLGMIDSHLVDTLACMQTLASVRA